MQALCITHRALCRQPFSVVSHSLGFLACTWDSTRENWPGLYLDILSSVSFRCISDIESKVSCCLQFAPLFPSNNYSASTRLALITIEWEFSWIIYLAEWKESERGHFALLLYFGLWCAQIIALWILFRTHGLICKNEARRRPFVRPAGHQWGNRLFCNFLNCVLFHYV